MNTELSAIQLKEYFENMPSKTSIDNLLASIKGIDAKLEDVGRHEKTIAGSDDDDAEDAVLEKSAVSGIMDFKVWNIPVGQAAIGGFVSVLATELVDGLMADSDSWKRGLVKIGLAGVAVKWGKKFLGDTGSKAVAILLAFDGIRDVTPLDSWAQSLANKITGNVPAAGLASHSKELQALRKANATKTVQTTVSNAENGKYYATAFGGR